MNRSILTMAAIGVLACMALTILMSQLLKSHPGKALGESAVREFATIFTGRLRESPQFKIREVGFTEKSVSVEVCVKPKVTTEIPECLREMGRFLWKQKFNKGAVSQVVIVWADPASGENHRDMAHPPRLGKVKRLTGRSTPSKSKAKKSLFPAKPRR